MDSAILNKIITKAKGFDFEQTRGYSAQKPSSICAKQEIALYPDYPEGVFVIQENMIFGVGQLEDSSYTVYEFDKEGNYKALIDINELPADFIRRRQTIYCIK